MEIPGGYPDKAIQATDITPNVSTVDQSPPEVVKQREPGSETPSTQVGPTPGDATP